jgi:type II secretory ATPase GspE/PulE/Tfp pilus assembly ATPase PilB-like protein
LELKALEELFLEKNFCTQEDIKKAQTVQKEYSGRIGLILLNWGILNESQLLEVYSEYFGIEYQERVGDFEKEKITTDIPDSFWIQNRIIPYKKVDNTLYILLSDPYKLDLFSFIEQHTHLTPSPILTSSQTLDTYQMFYDTQDENEATVFDDEIDKLKELASEAPIIQKVNLIFTKAVSQRASDIHFESFKAGMTVRLRVDGKLTIIEHVSLQQKASVIARLKLLSSMNIAENRLPQDGRISIKVSGVDIDIRASSIPTADGESFVLRLLGKQSVTYSLGALDFFPDHIKILTDIIKAPHGVFLTTGPTGSGKTTTLYTLLNEMNTEDRKIITVEDPVEYELDGINQIQVKSEIDFTFANALRSILRQDPDVIMIGEIRDEETANIAIQSSLTGHFVLSTLHTNSALGAISRLLDIGIELFLINASVTAVMAQRLVRKLCPHCKEEVHLDKETLQSLGVNHLLERHPIEKIRTYKARGCQECANTGYKGRVPVAEIIPFSSELKRCFDENPNFNDLASLNIRSIREDAILKFLIGLTSLEEIRGLSA